MSWDFDGPPMFGVDTDKKAFVIEDAYYPCCGLQFRNKDELLKHKLDNIEAHREEILRHLERGRLLWLFVYRQGRDFHAEAVKFVDGKLNTKM